MPLRQSTAHGSVWYDWEDPLDGLGPRRPPPRWLANLIGRDYFGHVTRVRLPASANDLLMRIASFDRLEYLQVSPFHMIPLHLQHLKPLAALQVLRLEHNTVNDAELVHLAGLTELRALNLDGTDIGDIGLSHLENLTQLRRLGLWRTSVTDRGIAHLAKLKELRYLDLGCTDVRNDGLAQLSRLPHLRELNLSYTGVTDSGLACLDGHPEITWVDLRHTAVTDAGARRLRKSLPHAAILGGSNAPPLNPWQCREWEKSW